MISGTPDTLPAAVDADFVVPAGHPCLRGHFPGRPVVPGVVVLDRVLAAAEGLLGEVPAGLRLPQVKFVRPLLPDEPARLRLEPARGADGGLRVKFRVALRGRDEGMPDEGMPDGGMHDGSRDGETIATGELVLPAARPAGAAPAEPAPGA